MQREGDAEDKFTAWSKLLSHYASTGNHPRALETAASIDELLKAHPEIGGWLDLSIASTLVFKLREHQQAKPFLERALLNLENHAELEEPLRFLVRIEGLRLAIQVAEGADKSGIEETLDRLTSHLGPGCPDYELIPIFEALIRAGHPRQKLEYPLLRMWADAMMQHRFWRLGSREDIQKIEALLASIGVHPQA